MRIGRLTPVEFGTASKSEDYLKYDHRTIFKASDCLSLAFSAKSQRID